MKALFLTREYPPRIYGGAGVVVDELTRALARRMAVEVRCFDPPAPPVPAIRARAYAAWAELAAAAAGARYAPALAALSVGLAMAAAPVDADVAHAHTWYAALAGVLVRMLHGVPLVVTVHSLEPLRPWKAEQLGSGYRVSSWIERTALAAADRVVAVSAAMREDVLAHAGVAPERVVVVHNGIDLARFRPTGAREALAARGVRPPYVLFVGRISEQKGIFDLLEAADALPPAVQLVLCASSPDTPELAARLRAAVADRPRVRWIDEMVPVAELVQLYSHAACFACPSVYEPFGVINLEAMACQAPVVASAVGGIREVVVDGQTGLLVPPGRPEALAAALGTLLADPARARAMGAAGRRHVEARFGWDAVAARTEAVYREAIAAFDREAAGAGTPAR
jgi:glycogen synthase